MRKRLDINFEKLEGEEQQRKEPEVRNDNFSFFEGLGLDSEDQRAQDDDVVFPFFSVIRGLLYVYGDQDRPDMDVITHVHLQLQELIREMFSQQIINSLMKKSKKQVIPEYKSDLYNFSDNDDGQVASLTIQNQTRFKRILSKYLLFVFTEFSNAFTRIQSNLSSVKKKCLIQEDIQQNLTDHLYKQAIKKKLKERKQTQKDNDALNRYSDESIFNEQSANQCAESVDAGESTPPEISTDQSEQVVAIQPPKRDLQYWDLHMKNRIDSMSLEEFDKFMSQRSKTFASAKRRFLELLDPNGIGAPFQECLKSQTRFLNYCFCRIIRKIVVQCYEASHTPTDFSITKEDVIKFGYQVIRKYSERAKKYALTKSKVQKMAYQQFTKEYHSEGYGAFFNSKQKIKIVKQDTFLIEKDQQATEEDIKRDWNNMKASRIMWIDRVFAEKQLKNVIFKKLKRKSPNKYFEYLWDHWLKQNVSYDEFRGKMPYLFKSWFIGIGRSGFQM